MSPCKFYAKYVRCLLFDIMQHVLFIPKLSDDDVWKRPFEKPRFELRTCYILL